MNTLYLVGAILIIFNILDSVTTHIALYKLPDDLKAKESNPLMAKLFIRNYKVAQIIKHVLVSAGVVYFIISKDLYSLEVIATMLGLVVLNNIYILVGRKLTGRRIDSPIRRLQRLLRVPDKLYYVVVVIVIFGLSLLIVNNI
jgi:ABC-type phosphate/phosphonate transport system permease subunit